MDTEQAIKELRMDIRELAASIDKLSRAIDALVFKLNNDKEDRTMKVWMTIGYADHEGNENVDGVFTDPEAASRRVLKVIWWNWFGSNVTTPSSMNDFIDRAVKYIINHPDVTYWYVWKGSPWISECFPDYQRDKFGMLDVEYDTWCAIRVTELNKPNKED